MTDQNGGKPPKKQFFSPRHIRGWVVGTATIAALVVVSCYGAAATLLLTTGNPHAANVLDKTPLGFVITLILFAVVIASRKLSSIVLKLSGKLAVGLDIIHRDDDDDSERQGDDKSLVSEPESSTGTNEDAAAEVFEVRENGFEVIPVAEDPSEHPDADG